MTYRTEARHEVGRFDKTEVLIVTQVWDAALRPHFDGAASLVLSTGACRLHTNPTADECRALAQSLLAAAVDLDRIAYEQAQPVGEAA